MTASSRTTGATRGGSEKMRAVEFFKDNTGFYRKLGMLVLPIAFQQFMLAAVSASDALMLGVLSQASLSAVSLAGQVTFIFNLFMSGFATGTSILAAQYYGKGDRRSLEKIFAYVLRTSVMVSAVFFLASLFAPRQLMRCFTADETLISGGIVYLRVVAASYLFTGVSQIYLCILKNTGFALKSTVISSSVVVLNILLNAIFIYGIGPMPEMGIAGAALATSISKLIEMAWVILESLREGRIRLCGKYLVTSAGVLAKDYWRYSGPMLGDFLVWGFGFSMYSVIMGHLGSDAVAANSIANIVKNLIVCFCGGLANGGGIVVGNELGKGELKLAKRYGDLLFWLCILSGIASGAVLLLLSPAILHFANLSPAAVGYLKWMLLLCACYMVGKSFNMTVIAGIFPAGGDSKFGLICDIVTMWVYAVPCGFLAAFVLKLPVVAVFLIINLDEIVKLPVVIRHYRQYKWVRNLTR